MHFEGDKHRPKLIGITSCSRGAGVTTIAAGLAAALSETGDGNVLLADLNMDSQSTHPFFHGQPCCELTDALEREKRQSGMVSENLYMATAQNGQGNGSSMLPKRLSNIVPDLKASDYDYIVFDLPLTTTTSLTPRLAGKMDLVLLVIESEVDAHETLKQAAGLLTRSEARLSAVLNKTRTYVPRWLHRDL
jgi:Mrp family chromosome partitioning ATPase